MKPLRCPQCDDEHLQTFNIKGTQVQIESCNNCKGMWFDDGELAQILRQAEQDYSIEDEMNKSKRYCPQCDSRLWTFTYPDTNIKIETCLRCHGLWLDHGEYEQIIASRKAAAPPTSKSSKPSKSIKKTHPPVSRTSRSSPVKEQLIAWINQTIDQLLDFEG